MLLACLFGFSVLSPCLVHLIYLLSRNEQVIWPSIPFAIMVVLLLLNAYGVTAKCGSICFGSRKGPVQLMDIRRITPMIPVEAKATNKNSVATSRYTYFLLFTLS